MTDAELVNEWAARKGYKIAWAKPDIVDLVRTDITGRKEKGEFDNEFYDRVLGKAFRYTPSGAVSPVRSILMLVMPRPAHTLRFETGNGIFEAIIPVTYAFYSDIFARVIAEIEGLLGSSAGGEDRHRLERISAPLKGTAARCGLVVYGRNNITYTKDFGSYQQILGYYTDIEPEGFAALPTEPSVMEQCRNCRICLNACPTKAIDSDRFLLHAERCITYLDEYMERWPDWLPSSSHNALIGCVRCQERCPANHGRLKVELLPEIFTLMETQTILEHTEGAIPESMRQGGIWDGIRAKLKSAGLAGMDEILGRNLPALRPNMP
jgi:epoxyqueuosine reductase